MSYDFSHLSPQDTKTALRLVQKIEELSSDLELCNFSSSKSIIQHSITVYTNLLDLYKDPDKYSSCLEVLNDVTIR